MKNMVFKASAMIMQPIYQWVRSFRIKKCQRTFGNHAYTTSFVKGDNFTFFQLKSAVVNKKMK